MTDRPGAFAGLAVAWHPHHVEHLAPWCEIMGMPMLVPDRPRLRAAALAYPGLEIAWTQDVVVPDWIEQLAWAIRQRAPSAVFYSELFERPRLRAMLGGRRESPRVVYVPHGFSEKRQDWARTTAFQDVAVLHGQHAFDQLAAMGVAGYLNHFALSGNVRRAYYRRHEAHFRTQAEGLGLGDDRPGRTLLYAPTWEDAIGSSSFFAAFASFAKQLPAGWRLVAKLHPHAERHASAINELERTCAGRDVRVVRGSPLTYPLLDLADAYVGDMSSLAYDYLESGRPMFFTNPTAGSSGDAAGSRLFACGTVIEPERYGELWRIVDDAWSTDAERFGEARAALDRYTHAPERPFGELRDEMMDLCSGPPPSWMYAKLDAPRGGG
jgi:hypothetical protein